MDWKDSCAGSTRPVADFEKLLTHHTPLRTSLLSGFDGAFSHIPLFLPGTYQRVLGRGHRRLLVIPYNLLLQSIIYAQVWQGTQGSVLRRALLLGSLSDQRELAIATGGRCTSDGLDTCICKLIIILPRS
jgi:hypothetical protein